MMKPVSRDALLKARRLLLMIRACGGAVGVYKCPGCDPPLHAGLSEESDRLAPEQNDALTAAVDANSDALVVVILDEDDADSVAVLEEVGL